MAERAEASNKMASGRPHLVLSFQCQCGSLMQYCDTCVDSAGNPLVTQNKWENPCVSVARQGGIQAWICPQCEGGDAVEADAIAGG